jgi:PEP-CTERM motif
MGIEMRRSSRAITICAAATVLLSAPAYADVFTATFAQVGSNVVVTGSGSIDVSGLVFVEKSPIGNGVGPTPPVLTMGLVVGNSNGVSFSASSDFYSATFSGPDNFGQGKGGIATSGTGNEVGLVNDPQDGLSYFIVPANYQSGDPLSDSLTFANTTLAGLGLAPGTYTYTFGTNDSFVIDIPGQVAAVPEPATWAMMILGFFGVGFMAYRRKQSEPALRLT